MLVCTLEHVKAKRLATNWVKWKAKETIGDTLSDLKNYALANPKAHTI